MRKILIKKGIVFILLGLLICISITPTAGNILQDVNDAKKLQDAFDNLEERMSCDHLAYLGADYLSDCWLYEIILNDPSNLICTCGGENISYYTGTWTNNGTIIACRANTGLVEINPETCEVKEIGIGGCFQGLSMDPTTGNLYGGLVTGFSGGLWLIDIKTGDLEYIGDYITSDCIVGLAFDAEGTLYGWDINPDYLYKINKETGEATSIGSLDININYQSDGHFCMEDDILYIVAFTTSPIYGCSLYECNKDYGSCTLIGQFEDNTTVSLLAIPYNWSNQPPNPLEIIGPNYGQPGVNYTFCIRVVDPEEDAVYFLWDWGDGEPMGWFGPYASGDLICFTHAWSEEGTYTIKVKAKDEYGEESNWMTHIIVIDGGVPSLKISKPRRAIYIRDRLIFPYILPLIFGDIQIWFSAEDSLSGLNRTELFIDDELKEVFTVVPKSWMWNETNPLKYKYVIKLIAFDNAGNNATKKMPVLRFF